MAQSWRALAVMSILSLLVFSSTMSFQRIKSSLLDSFLSTTTKSINSFGSARQQAVLNNSGAENYGENTGSSALLLTGGKPSNDTKPTHHNYNITTAIIPITEKIRNLPRSEPDFLMRTSFLKDDLSIGKSCKKATKGWECRDCGGEASLRSNRSASIVFDWSRDCSLVAPRGICKPLTTWEWDPRQVSMHDPTDPNEHRHVLHHYGMENHTYEQVPCENLEDCWDMNKCSGMTGGGQQQQALTVFGYGDYAVSLIKNVAELFPSSVQWVSDPEAACLLLATMESFDTPDQLHSQPSWNGGRNHFFWIADAFFDSHQDQPFNLLTNFDHAALSTAAFQDANIRLGYDIPLARLRHTSAEFHQTQLPNLTISGKRPTLLNFKGNIFRMPQVWWHHRYLAFEYWEESPSVVCDIVCKMANRFRGRTRKYATPRNAYAALMLNTTFAFCPGGGSVNSFRFAEALGLGAIPVVTSEFVAPLAPEIDWSGCLIRVSEARIIDIPRIVRAISEEEVVTRQERCRYLFDTTIGWIADADGWSLDRTKSFSMALLIWHQRIENYHRFKQRGENILQKAAAGHPDLQISHNKWGK